MTADRPGRDGETRCAAAFTTPWGDRRCDLPSSHEGLHVRNDGCGRPEYFWTSPTPTARWDDEPDECHFDAVPPGHYVVEDADYGERLVPIPASSAARDGDNDRLREEVARWLFDRYRLASFEDEPWDRRSGRERDEWCAEADALLAGSLRQLTTERDEAVAAVQRVRKLHAPDARVPEICSECSDEVTVGWPCDTIRAANGYPS